MSDTTHHERMIGHLKGGVAALAQRGESTTATFDHYLHQSTPSEVTTDAEEQP